MVLKRTGSLRCSHKLHQIGERDQARLENIIQSSLKKVMKHLSKKESEPAISILSNLGYVIDDKLWEITLMTEDSQIHEFVVSILKSRSSLQPHYQEIIDYASSIKDGYPCTSFTAASNLLAEEKREKEELEYLPSKSTAKFDLSNQCGELMMPSSPMTESSPGLYAEVLWDWLRFWDGETKQKVFLDSKLRKGDVTQIYKDVDSRLLLNYLLRHNRVKDLTLWINKLVENKDFVTLQMIVNNLDNSTVYVRDVVLDICARNGIIKEPVDFTDLLSSLRLVGGPFMKSHPAVRFHTGDTDGFHSDFIQYCVTNNLPSVLWYYCHHYQISSKLLQKLSYNIQDCTWIQMFNLFYCLTKNSHDSVVMYEASLANAGMTWSLEQPSVSQLLKIGETLTAMATLLYSPYDIHQVVPGVSKLQAIDDMSIEEVEKALLPYPKLHSALFPASTIDTPKNDVSVYDLLKDNAPFDPTRLFGWQTTNKLAGEDCLRHLPHFSSTDLVSKYGVVEKIKYTYYLKQGRPSFAFTSFLAEELDSDATTISSSRLLQATSTALWIGVRNFHVSQVSCACVVFTELLGQDSVLLRTHLQVGQEILIHLNQSIRGTGEKRKENIKRNEEQIINWLCGCILNRKKYGGFVLQKLENAIIASVAQDRIPETSFDAAQKWLIAVLFCRVLQLPMTTKFLEICAQADKWLPFLWFSQMHQYTKDQLQTILYHFKSQHLQQHLHYVIENAEAKTLLIDKTKPEKAKSKAKDSRSALYSRIGVSNKEETTVDVSSSEEEAQTELAQTLTLQNIDTESEEGMTIDIQSVPDDIFGVVFMAQKSKCPWKSLLQLSVLLCNPILAELAACFKDALIQPCICGWLVAMMDSVERDKILKDHGRNISKWTIKHSRIRD
ncbi:hypothetical protein KUTeg_017732 [Tegillarca granosa]|uniref:Uncharacterized protein n=1 Tax=Tegillarca granosa TaxID=220873 RepID=A0ABQ9EFS4_TEGGR|nr:hypothetical protein KUTeg_017732 [Tegillarca granosa]